MDKILVTGYHNIDLDGAACAYAYTELLNQLGSPAVFGISGSLEVEPSYVFKKLNLKALNADKILCPKTKIIICDASESRWLSKNINPLQVIEVIDHRTINEVEVFKNAKVQIAEVGACATLIAERFEQEKVTPSRESATALFLAIVSNTINFMSSLTTKRDINEAIFLKELYCIPDTFIHEMFVYKSTIKNSVIKVLEEDLNHYTFNGMKICVLQLEIVDASNFISRNITAISDALINFKNLYKYDCILLSCIDIEKGGNTFIAVDSETKVLLKDILGLKFKLNISRRSGVIMRKQLLPKIKQYFEK